MIGVPAAPFLSLNFNLFFPFLPFVAPFAAFFLAEPLPAFFFAELFPAFFLVAMCALLSPSGCLVLLVLGKLR